MLAVSKRSVSALLGKFVEILLLDKNLPRFEAISQNDISGGNS